MCIKPPTHTLTASVRRLDDEKVQSDNERLVFAGKAGCEGAQVIHIMNGTREQNAPLRNIQLGEVFTRARLSLRLVLIFAFYEAKCDDTSTAIDVSSVFR
jgi:hypothetical protein